MTKKELTKIAAMALDVSAAAPLKQNEYAFAAKIPWTLINDLRSAFDEAGFDWRKFKEEADAKRDENARRWDEKRRAEHTPTGGAWDKGDV